LPPIVGYRGQYNAAQMNNVELHQSPQAIDRGESRRARDRQRSADAE
jgi:hypothetical protein